MYLQHEDYVEPVKPVKVVPDVKEAIKEFVGKGKKSYEEIVKEVQKKENITNDNVIKQIKEVQVEWYPLPKPEEVEEVDPVEEIRSVEPVTKDK